MRELGRYSKEAHLDATNELLCADVDRVFLVGEETKVMRDAMFSDPIFSPMFAGWYETGEEAINDVLEEVGGDDLEHAGLGFAPVAGLGAAREPLRLLHAQHQASPELFAREGGHHQLQVDDGGIDFDEVFKTHRAKLTADANPQSGQHIAHDVRTVSPQED